MNVIAYKKEGIGFMYLCVAIVGALLVALGIAMETFYYWALGAIIGITGVVIFVRYVRLPYKVIWLEDGKLCHPGGALALLDINDVSYKCATARGIQYQWGSITLDTHLGTFKYGYIADCENVAKRITDMVYRERYGINEGDQKR